MAGQTLKQHAIYYGFSILIGFLELLPVRWMGLLGRTFGFLAFQLAKPEREKTIVHIRTAFPQTMTWNEAERLARAVWIRLGWNLFEEVRWIRMSREEVVSQAARVYGWEQLEKAQTRQKGVILVSAHLGNWELLAAYFASKMPMAAEAPKLYDSRFEELVIWARENILNVRTMERDLVLRRIEESLQDHQAVLLLVDQDGAEDGVFVPFLGKLAWTPSNAARIAYETEAALVPVFMVRGADGRFELYVEREIEVPRTGEAKKDILETVRRYTEAVESYVKAYPDQWIWTRERWKTKPPSPESAGFS